MKTVFESASEPIKIMNFISERRASLHISLRMIACHLLDGCLLSFLILLIPIPLTLKKSSQWETLSGGGFHLSQMMWFCGNFVILSEREGVGKIYMDRSSQLRDDGMKTTKLCPWKRRGSSLAPWFSYQVMATTRSLDFQSRLTEFKSQVCCWPAVWFGSVCTSCCKLQCHYC